jgi:gluconolactonase
VQSDGSVTHRRDFATLEAGGNGDGMAIDAMGRLYVTSPPGVQVFDRAGSYWADPDARKDQRRVCRLRQEDAASSQVPGADGKEFTIPQDVRNNANIISCRCRRRITDAQ